HGPIIRQSREPGNSNGAEIQMEIWEKSVVEPHTPDRPWISSDETFRPMSIVDNFALFVHRQEGPGAVVQLNRIIGERYHGDPRVAGFVDVRQYAGGLKHFEANCYLYAGKYCSLGG